MKRKNTKYLALPVLILAMLFSANCATMLQKAAMKGDIEMAKQALAKGESVDETHALIIATNHAQVDMVKFLIENKATVDLKGSRQRTALQYAAMTPNPDEKDIQQFFQNKIEVAKVLLQKGADAKTVDESGATTVINALGSDFVEAAQDQEKRLKKIKDLDQVIKSKMATPEDYQNYRKEVEGYNEAKKKSDEKSAKLSALNLPYENMLDILIKAGADVKAKDSITGNTAVHYATKRGSINSIDMLLKKGADINAANNLDSTPLHEAVENQKAYEFLVSKKANILAVNSSGFTPYNIAPWRINIFNAAGSNDTARVSEYIKAGGRVNIYGAYKGIYGWTPMHVAAYEGSKGAAEAMLAGGADINSIFEPESNKAGELQKITFPFSFGGLTSGFTSLAKGDIEIPTPLMMAKKNKKEDMASFLSGKGAVDTFNLKNFATFSGTFNKYPRDFEKK